MNASLATIEATERLAVRDSALMAALHDWHGHKGLLFREDRDKSFDQWLRDLVIYFAGQFREVDPAPERIVKALEINAVGDKLASYWARHMAKEHGCKADTNCYMEEGVVFANVWLNGESAAFTKAYAEEVADSFRKAGYTAEVWVDEEDDTEVTVNAQIDFDIAWKKLV